MNTIVISGRLYRDDNGMIPLPGLIGPFKDRADATAWLDDQGPLWGSRNLESLVDPASLAPSSSDASPAEGTAEEAERLLNEAMRLRHQTSSGSQS